MSPPRTAAAFTLVVATASVVSIVAHHKRPAPAASAQLAAVIPLSPRASRAHTREALPVRVKTLRHRQRPHLSIVADRAHDWDAVAQCESSGDWHINTGNGYFGGLQEDMTFWRTYDGPRFASRPDLASRDEQITVAEHGLAVQGRGAWPVCGRFL